MLKFELEPTMLLMQPALQIGYQGAKCCWGVARICEKRKNLTKFDDNYYKKRLRILLRLGGFKLDSFKNQIWKTKDFTDQTLLANVPRPLAEKYNRSKIQAS